MGSSGTGVGETGMIAGSSGAKVGETGGTVGSSGTSVGDTRAAVGNSGEGLGEAGMAGGSSGASVGEAGIEGSVSGVTVAEAGIIVDGSGWAIDGCKVSPAATITTENAMHHCLMTRLASIRFSIRFIHGRFNARFEWSHDLTFAHCFCNSWQHLKPEADLLPKPDLITIIQAVGNPWFQPLV